MKNAKYYVLLIIIILCLLAINTVYAENTNNSTSYYSTLDNANSAYNLDLINPNNEQLDYKTTSYEKAEDKSSNEKLRDLENTNDSNNHNEHAQFNGKTIEITNENYEMYFNKYTGDLLSNDTINDGDILKIGNVSNRIFKLNKRLFITSIDPNDRIYNGAIHLLKGSDGSTVTYINIFNDQIKLKVNGVSGPVLNGLYMNNTNHNIISFNNIELISNVGLGLLAYNSSYNQIVHNSIHTGDSNDESTSCLVMDLSDYNNISFNDLRTIQSNVIYFNHYGWAGARDVCTGNLISNNYIHTDIVTPMCYGMQIVYGFHNGTAIINNTIDNVARAIQLDGENITIIGNIISNFTEAAINSNGINGIISDNTIIQETPTVTGISTLGTNFTVANNRIDMLNGTNFAIQLSANSSCYNNRINLGTYGTGIIVSQNGSSVSNNTINTKFDNGIKVDGSQTKISDNIINTDAKGIYIRSPGKRINNITIIGNRINSEDNGIYIYGLIYNSTIGNNIINTNATEGIHKKVTDEEKDLMFDNIINGIITDPTAITVNDSNFYQYFDKKGYFTFKFKEGVNGVVFLSVLTNKSLKIDKKLYLMSNQNNNYLYNVTIDLLEGSDGSIIKDLSFYNANNTKVITLSNVNNVMISGNNISLINNNLKGRINEMVIPIAINGLCDNTEISNNNIYINTNSSATGINISPSKNRKDSSDDFESGNMEINESSMPISRNQQIFSNNIIINSNDAIGIRTGLLMDSAINNNYINILSDANAYGIVLNNSSDYNYPISIDENEVINSNNVSINTNTIIIYAKNESNGMILNNLNDSQISKNILKTNSSETNAINLNSANNISLTDNRISAFITETNLEEYKLNQENSSVIKISKDSQRIAITNNTIDCNLDKQMEYTKKSHNINISSNVYVIGDYNYLNYFSSLSEGILNSSIKKGDTILFKNLSKADSFIINVPLNISSYGDDYIVSSKIILNGGSSNTRIHDLIFEDINDLEIILNNTLKVQIDHNIFRIKGKSINNYSNCSNYSGNNILPKSIIIVQGIENKILDNDFIINNSNIENPNESNIMNLKLIEVNKSDKTQIGNNEISSECRGSFTGIIVNNSKNTEITNNNIVSKSDLNKIIVENDNIKSQISSNNLEIYGKCNFGYISNNSQNNSLIDNGILITGINQSNKTINSERLEELLNQLINPMKDLVTGNQTGIYSIDSNNTIIKYNDIESIGSQGDYAIYIASKDNSTIITNNNLISDNKNKVADNAIYYIDSIVTNNTPYKTFVSLNGSDEDGDGSEENPYRTIEFALKNAYNNIVIYLDEGIYNENDLEINKNITIIGKNETNNKNVIINLNNGKLFEINENSSLTIAGIEFINGNSLNGTVFLNKGNLNIINSSFHNNTAINYNTINNNSEVSGFGAVATNYGNISIENSSFYKNTAHKGGVIMNYGDLKINNSEFINNSAVSGGVIYNKGNCNIDNSKFINNTALKTVEYCITHMYNKDPVSDCCAVGSGGAIFNDKNTSLDIKSSEFNKNTAVDGGAIYYSNEKSEKDNSNLRIINSTLNDNKAKKSGGAISGSVNTFVINGTELSNNEAYENGGAISLNTSKGRIDSSRLVNNTAKTGGAIDCTGDVTVTNTYISNNTATNGGAINFKGHSSYGHINNHMIIENSTIDNNRGLDKGGAINLYNGNIRIANSNVVNNYAPKNPTITTNGNYNLDVDNNVYWGSSKGPTDDVWNSANLDKRNWTKNMIEWDSNKNSSSHHNNNESSNPHRPPIHINPHLPEGTSTSLIPNNGGSNAGNNNGGSGTGTNSGNGNGNGNRNGEGNGNGNSNGNGNGQGNGEGNGNGQGNTNGTGNGNGNAMNSNGQNKNSNNTNTQYEGVGTSGDSAGSSSSGEDSSSSPKAYKIENDNPIVEKTANSYNMLFIILLFSILVYIGYKREQRKSNK